MGKQKVCISISADLIEWLDQQAETQRFRNRSHGIEVAVLELKKTQTEQQEKGA
jgi:metal-responsive CopG/Arc/MetJ family transcriptional regulator